MEKLVNWIRRAGWHAACHAARSATFLPIEPTKVICVPLEHRRSLAKCRADVAPYHLDVGPGPKLTFKRSRANVPYRTPQLGLV